jgi:acetoin utilization deacetylase AcuC-like enzyme
MDAHMRHVLDIDIDMKYGNTTKRPFWTEDS